MRFKKKLGAAAAVLIATAGLAVGTGSAAHASGSVCTVINGQLGCANRAGGGTVVNTAIIGWHNDGNSDFFPDAGPFGSFCNHGTVDEHSSCPFAAGSGLNTQFNGDVILQLDDSFGCIATGAEAPGAYKAILNSCGANGYIFVQTGGNAMVNVRASNTWFTSGHSAAAFYLFWDANFGHQLTYVDGTIESW